MMQKKGGRIKCVVGHHQCVAVTKIQSVNLKNGTPNDDNKKNCQQK